ncbi:MAG: autotransporter-associated beta strand repeat-containing protein, partial [Bacteroidales bacterium]|nr:autotransporter-associated beta strand repeat-containing protein [Bacteroidales bacterium]
MNKLIRQPLLSFLLLLVLVIPTGVSAQRIQQTSGRGVVAVNNGTTVTITWRKLAQEPANTSYNIYRKQSGAADYTLLNSTPLRVTNYQTSTSTVPSNSLLAVRAVINGVEQPLSVPFQFVTRDLRSRFLDITYDHFLPNADYTTKFVWPADLDGDGEYDYVVSRLTLTGGTDKIEGYTRQGVRLWTVDMGPNVSICDGQDDMVIAYDMDCDGKSEVVIKSSDGTRFWDKANNNWGAWLLASSDGDTDHDGLINYATQNVKNPPQYITVIDGETGAEQSTIEMNYASITDGSDTYTRFNKSAYMGGADYSNLNGHMGIAYLDGKHPSVVMEYLVRTTDKTHHNYVSAWGYRFVNGKTTSWEEKFPTWSRNNKSPWPAEFHHIRIGDVDLDGCDEMLEGGYAVDHDGDMLFSAGISHGDRFRVGDINPDRPGLETFAIQQNAGDMLGMILYDAATGSPLKKWYLASVGDVGRGECMDVNLSKRGYEMWSTMGNLYGCDGSLVTSGGTPFPTEGIWWDGELDREMLSAADGNGFNAHVQKYDGTRLIQFAKESNWTVSSEYGTRPLYFGDMIGDWREEVILKKSETINSVTSCSGIAGYSTDYTTSKVLYHLQENPMYRMQCTTRGYYQSAFPDYYLGGEMPEPPLPPSMVTDLVWASGSEWNKADASFTTFDQTATQPFTDGKSVLFDVTGSTTDITLNGELAPSVVYAMIPKDKSYTFRGTGSLQGAMDLWKSQNGTLVLNNTLAYTGTTYISEGTLELNTTLGSPVYLQAKGTLSGTGTLTDTLLFEGGLNDEGCRLSPGTSSQRFATLSFGNLNLTGGVRLEMDLQTEGTVAFDTLQIQGDLTLSNSNKLIIRCAEKKPLPGEYPLIHWTGALKGDTTALVLSGLSGIARELKVVNNTLILVIKATRDPQEGIRWTGAQSTTWDFDTENFAYEGVPTTFVSGDGILFDDDVVSGNVVLSDKMTTSSVTFNNESKSYTLSGTGGLSGKSSLTKNGAGKLKITNENNDYTGATIINGGTLEVTSLSDGGAAGTLGAASSLASNLQLNDATFIINNANTATTRGMKIGGETTINVSRSGSYATMKGMITGSGKLIKSGAGQLSLTFAGVNSYSGGTILRSGTLAMGTWQSTFGAVGSPITLEGGTLQIFDNNNTSAVPQFNYALTVPAGANATLRGGQRCNVSGTLTGEGNLTFYSPYVRADVTANWSAFRGILNVITDGDGGDFRINSGYSMPYAEINLGAGVYAYNQAGSVVRIGALSGSGTLAGNHGWEIGSKDTNSVFTGTITATGTIRKIGTGNLTLGSNQSYTTATLVDAGRLIINGSFAAPVTVKSGAVLGGSGNLTGTVTVLAGGAVDAGEDPALLSIAQINLAQRTLTASNLAMRSGSSLRITIANPSGTIKNDLVKATKMSVEGVSLDLLLVRGQEIAAGSSLTLLNCADITGHFSTITLDGVDISAVCDTSRLYTEGILSLTQTVTDAYRPTETSVSWPNPVQDILYIPCQAGEQIELYDAGSRLIYQKQATGTPHVLPMK